MLMERNYTDREARLARYAKALGHPARIAILRFLARQEHCFFGGDPRGAAHFEGHGLAASQRS